MGIGLSWLPKRVVAFITTINRPNVPPNLAGWDFYKHLLSIEFECAQKGSFNGLCVEMLPFH